MKPKKWSPVDPRHFEGKSPADLRRELQSAVKFEQRHPEFQLGWHNEYVQELRRRIAESIGK